jgi:hypothetical protein
MEPPGAPPSSLRSTEDLKAGVSPAAAAVPILTASTKPLPVTVDTRSAREIALSAADSAFSAGCGGLQSPSILKRPGSPKGGPHHRRSISFNPVSEVMLPFRMFPCFTLSHGLHPTSAPSSKGCALLRRH